MIQRKISKIIGAAIIATLLFSTFTAAGMNLESNEQPIAETKLTDRPYDGHLRVYVVEPISRFDNYDGDPYHFGFLDFAIDEQLSIDYLDTYTKQVIWDAQQAGYSNVEEQNIIVNQAQQALQCYDKGQITKEELGPIMGICFETGEPTKNWDKMHLRQTLMQLSDKTLVTGNVVRKCLFNLSPKENQIFTEITIDRKNLKKN